jgi:DNA-binding NarL/FixJ family response regulator
MTRRPRILLADDHTILLDSFKRLLEPACEVVGCVKDGRALLQAAPRLNPDAIVLDISMPLLNGLEAAIHLKKSIPDTKLIFLTVNEDPDLAVEAFHRGASAYLLKNSASSELFTAIENALQGKIYFTPLVTNGTPVSLFLKREVKTAAQKLTDRQREVLQLLAEGRLMKEVADILKVTPRTVAFHKYAMMEGLGVKTTAELVQYAVQHGIVASKTQVRPEASQ